MLLGELGRFAINRGFGCFVGRERANGVASCNPFAELPFEKFDSPIVLEFVRSWFAREGYQFTVGVETETDGRFGRCMASAGVDWGVFDWAVEALPGMTTAFVVGGEVTRCRFQRVDERFVFFVLLQERKSGHKISLVQKQIAQ